MGLFKKKKVVISSNSEEPTVINRTVDTCNIPNYLSLCPDDYRRVSFTQSKTYRGYKRITLSITGVPGGYDNIRLLGKLNTSYVSDPKTEVVAPGYSIAWHDTNKYTFDLSGKTICFHLPYDTSIPTSVFVDERIVGIMPYQEDDRRSVFYRALLDGSVSAAHILFQSCNRCEVVSLNGDTEKTIVKDTFRAYLFLPV